MGKSARLKRARRTIQAAAKTVAATGVFKRVAAVRKAVASPFFEPAFRTASLQAEKIALVTEMETVRRLALSVLERDFGCDTAGVLLTFEWEPATKQLRVHCRPDAEAAKPVAAAIARVADDIKGQRPDWLINVIQPIAGAA